MSAGRSERGLKAIAARAREEALVDDTCREWLLAVADALAYAGGEKPSPRLDALRQRVQPPVLPIERDKTETFLGFALADEEWESLRKRAVESGKWQ